VTFLLFLVFLFAPQDKPPDTCSLSGIVLNSVTGDPLNKVELMLEPLDRSADPVATATSTAEGRFTMLDLDPGRYKLKGARSGPTARGQSSSLTEDSALVR
jgi:5-hydroxyisourate hydrolase-like protein (transthyretin family)